MVFGRRKRDEARGDVFKRSIDERRATEDQQPWFLADDDDADLDIQAGIGSNLKDGELDS